MTDKKHEPTEAELRAEAKQLGSQMDDLESKIKNLISEKSKIAKQLRSVHGKLVTMELKK